MKKNIIYIIIIIILITTIISIYLLPNKNNINNKKNIKSGLSINGVINVNLNDDIGKPISDFTISLYDEDGKYMDKENTDRDGIAVFKITQTGLYIISKTSKIKGYETDNKSYEVIVSEKEPIVSIDLVNKIQRGNILFLVTNKKEKGLENIKIELYNEKNEKIKDLLTDDKGLTEIKDIPIGKYYYFVEKEEKKQEIVINQKDETVTKTIKINK